MVSAQLVTKESRVREKRHRVLLTLGERVLHLTEKEAQKLRDDLTSVLLQIPSRVEEIAVESFRRAIYKEMKIPKRLQNLPSTLVEQDKEISRRMATRGYV